MFFVLRTPCLLGVKSHILFLLLTCSPRSYLDPPRIHFSGWFLADVATRNNFNCFDGAIEDNITCEDVWNWNPNGTGEFSFYNCHVTSVVYADGSIAMRKEDDPVIGGEILTNPNIPPAKLVDLDNVVEMPVIYGMTIVLNWGENMNTFIGKWVPTSIDSDMYEHQNPKDPYQVPFGAQGRSLIENLHWSRTLNSKALQQLKYFSDQSGVLSITFSLYNFTKNPNETWWKHGRIVGSIGVGRRDEPLSFPGHRALYPAEDAPTIRLSEAQHTCGIENKFLMGTAYFNVGMRRVTVDLGNSFWITPGGHICKLDPLHVGILLSEFTETPQVEIIAEVPYREEGWYESTAGVQDIAITDEQQRKLSSSKLVLVSLNDSGRMYPLCDKSGSSERACAALVLVETPLFIRPMDCYAFHLEKDQKATLRLIVRHFGNPVANAEVKLEDISLATMLLQDAEGFSVNTSFHAEDGLLYNSKALTDVHGIATFIFQAKGVPSRKHTDGMTYTFMSCLSSERECGDYNYGNTPTILVWSNVTYERPYFWDQDIQPIFKWYERLFPVMSRIVTLGDYESVTRPYMVALIKKSMSLDLNHPSYMPVTRQLSPTKRDMILEWLDSPDHYRSWEHIEVLNFQIPTFCKFTFYLNPLEGSIQVYSGNVSSAQKMDVTAYKYTRQFTRLAEHPPERALPLWILDAKEQYCSVESLKRDLQTAVALEFSTIPLYLTALYSIKDGYNQQVYNVIRSVVLQEMLHVAQVANLLISIGGRPIIDSRQYAPSYPTHLPAGILPQLEVSLKKASPKHISEVFMAIEYPHMNIDELAFHPELGRPFITLGHFYSHIRRCVTKLGTERNIFCRDCAQKQIQWPSEIQDLSTYLFTVTNLKSALDAIEMIVEQGEGASNKDPTYLETHMLSHFYKFEELACKRHMNILHQHSYNYEGNYIPFVPEGVWPMRDNPSKEGIPPNTPLYYEAKQFHSIYRSLLTSLQDAFDGNKKAMTDSMFIMEGMAIHMKRLMQMPIPTKEGWPAQTCGPVFDYDWD